jgi:hypothetical protein
MDDVWLSEHTLSVGPKHMVLNCVLSAKFWAVLSLNRSYGITSVAVAKLS